MEEPTESRCLCRDERKALEKAKIIQRENRRKSFKMISEILKKDDGERTEKELAALQQNQDIAEELCKRKIQRTVLKRKQEEMYDSTEELQLKVKQLAEAMQMSKSLVIYTGAGISTAASIPDYRGPDGVWTRLKRGLPVSVTDLSQAEPTFTHMCIKMLHEEKLVQHVVSQNCDGLHLRSGFPRQNLSELHGNMFIEVCTSCTPTREYIRLFDVTERTAKHRHATGRQCGECGGDLRDTIVHFGERGTLDWPLNWNGAIDAAEHCDAILCLGSSLKVLKKYPRLWCMTRPASRRPRLYIVNLQWTPKDDMASLKIHGKCDVVMSLLMEELNIKVPAYNRDEDPIVTMATPLGPAEEASHTRRLVNSPSACPQESSDCTDESSEVRGGWFGRGYNKGQRKKLTAQQSEQRNSDEKMSKIDVAT
ncbi:NAD-dependent protein deacetylase sirtuin-7 [Engraulis encrasicolus]|uniref:NAD-dependent protein deacetylase sirtuin-7 n=1 Tax=Engraulis encrasicolus TaxID=184585 RepID=UPI002FD38975